MADIQIKGGVVAHIARRLFHVFSIIGVPLIYYYGLLAFYQHTDQIIYILLCLIVIVILFELLRIKKQWLIFGQRSYEKGRPSAFAWTVLSLVILLLLSPNFNVAMAIAVSCALVDPLLGEMRARHYRPTSLLIVGSICIFIIWFFFGFPVWLSILMALVTVLAEKPALKWIDDNAMMLLSPLLLILLL